MPQRPLKRTAQSLTGDIELDFGRYELRRPKSFGHADHTYYQIACILAVLGKHQAVFEWLERSVGSGFACWPFFLKHPGLKNLRGFSEFETLVSSQQAKYPDHLGLL